MNLKLIKRKLKRFFQPKEGNLGLIRDYLRCIRLSLGLRNFSPPLYKEKLKININ